MQPTLSPLFPHRSSPDTPVIVFDESGKPKPELIATLEAVASNGCILATGHLQASEVMKLVPLALEIGVRRVILTRS